MNKTPNTSGIDRYWKEGDARLDVRRLSRMDNTSVDAVLDAFTSVVRDCQKTVLVGFGTFEWVQVRGKRLPDGTMTDGWRLSFIPSRKIKRDGEHYGNR